MLRIHFHDIRHTHAALLLEAGENVKYVAERLGDREDTVVGTYAHVTPRMRSSAVSKVRGFLGADPGARDSAVVHPTVVGEKAAGEPFYRGSDLMYRMSPKIASWWKDQA